MATQPWYTSFEELRSRTPEYEVEILSRQIATRLLEPEEVVRLVLFLAADDSTAIAHQRHIIDGGFI
jgi:NAD(P)-dependent dehydrogenase (short-subunit alcohol dehydrogenase family)